MEIDVLFYKDQIMDRFREMHADREFDRVMDRLLTRVPDDIDKREGSVIWDALAPAAMEFVILYFDLFNLLYNSFGITADREALILRAMERNVHIQEATQAQVKGEFSRELPEGTRFNYEELNYMLGKFIKEEDGVYSYYLTCEEFGTVGNVERGTLTPIDYVPNLKFARIAGVLIPGEEAEGTEEFRVRYFESLQRDDYGGNIADYKRKVKELAGVGAVKVYPVWNGGGTVKLVIQDTQYKAPSEELVEEVQTAIDPITNQGKGIGIAPIGHAVTVVGVEEVPLKIKTSITLEKDAELSVVKPKIETYVKAYIDELTKEWEKSETTIVRVSQIESRILDVVGVLDVVDTSVNDETKQLKLSAESIPKYEAIEYV